jgi:transcriptional regulator with XRE-family HTH domain
MTNAKIPSLSTTIGRCIAYRRDRAGLTQDQVAERLQIGPEAVSRMERGITIPTVTRLAELAEIFQCGIDELLVESSTRTSDQAEHIASMLMTLPEADRAMLVEVVNKICERLKERL